MKIKYILPVFLLIGIFTMNAQTKDYELGADILGFRNPQQGGFYNYSDPEAVNIKVNVWGWLRFPGRYTVPSYTTVMDLISYAGGPTDGAILEDLRIYRIKPDSTEEMIKFSYNDLLYGTELESDFNKGPRLQAGDILLVPGEPKIYTRERVSMWTSILGALVSITILILNITNNN